MLGYQLICLVGIGVLQYWTYVSASVGGGLEASTLRSDMGEETIGPARQVVVMHERRAA